VSVCAQSLDGSLETSLAINEKDNTESEPCPCPCEPDLEINKKIEFQIKKRGKEFKLYSSVEVREVFLSKRSTLEDIRVIFEHPYSEISKLKVRFKGKKLDKNRINTFYPPRKNAFFSEDRMMALNLPSNIKKGDELHYTYRQEFDDISLIPIIKILNHDYIKSFIIKIKHPPEITIDAEFFFPRDELTYRLERVDEKNTVILFRDVCKAEELPYFNYNKIQASILLSVKKGDSTLSATTPESFIDWYSNQTTLEPALDRPEHGYIPYGPSEVLEKKYGDCKDRASLVSALARASDITVQMAVVSAEPDKIFAGLHPFMFNHMVAVYVSGNDTLLFDPTMRYTSFGIISESLVDEFAVIMDSENPAVISIRDTSTAPAIDVVIEGNLDSLKIARARITIQNNRQEAIRRAINDANDRDLQNYLDSVISSRFHGLSFDKFKLEVITKNGAVFGAGVDLSNFVVQGQNKKFVYQTPFITADRKLLERADDSYVIHFDDTDRLNLTIRLEHSRHIITEESLELGSRELSYYTATLRPVDSNHFELNYRFERPFKKLDKENKSEFMEFCREYLKSKSRFFALKEEL
jgi:hypothetical protein